MDYEDVIEGAQLYKRGNKPKKESVAVDIFLAVTMFLLGALLTRIILFYYGI